MFQTKVVEKIKIHILRSMTFFHENRAVYDNVVAKYGKAGQATDGKWRTRLECRIPKATNTNSK